MAKTTRLDRSNWSSLQHVSGDPSAATKGNVYVNDTTGDLWIRKSDNSWRKVSSLWALGTLAAGALTPLDSTNAVRIQSTSDNYLSTTGQNFITSNSDCRMTTISSGSIYLQSANSFLFTCENDIQLSTTTSTNTGDISIFSADSTSGNITISTNNAGSGNLYLKANGSGSNNIYIETDLSGAGNINITAAGNSGDISISSADGPGTSGDISILANNDHGSVFIEAIGGTSIGKDNYIYAPCSLAIGQHANPWWSGSVFATNDTFDSDYEDAGGQIISAVLHGETTNSSTELLFPDSSIITLPQSKYVYIEFKILAAGVNTSSRAAFSGHIIGRRLTNTVLVDSFSITRTSSYDDAMIDDPTYTAVTSTGFQINVSTTDANPFRWTMTCWGTYTDMYIGT